VLSRLQASDAGRSLNYHVIVQDADEVRDLGNAPAISMGQYLTDTEQTRLLTTLSIYSERGTTREQLRLLYMNEGALSLWVAMGKSPTVIAMRHRPPKTALLTLGVPFSE
jgi:hypothetical protein